MYFRNLVVFSAFMALTMAKIKFTNINCEVLEAAFCNITTCQLNVMRRGVIALNIYAVLLQKPVTTVVMNLSLFKKSSGYRPFLYNITFDFCDFMKNKKKYPVSKLVYDMTHKFSNLNHTCPYNHDIILKNMVLTSTMLQTVPLPDGEYMFKMMISSSNVPKVVVRAYFQQIE